MVKLVYCATPARLANRIKDIMDLVTNEGNAPFILFRLFLMRDLKEIL
ncbi:hypothetical protein J4447_00665 [Candidatus Pacearchaeota archaeon]|nr:hypothetical protein [Candidatus Pacearchaeota archaeon]